MSTQLRPVRSIGDEMDRILAQTRADDTRRTQARAALARAEAAEAATETADALLRLTIAAIWGETQPGAPVAQITLAAADGTHIRTVQLPQAANDLLAAALDLALAEYLDATGLDPALINRLAGGDADLSTSSDHRPALRAIQGGAAR